MCLFHGTSFLKVFRSYNPYMHVALTSKDQVIIKSLFFEVWCLTSLVLKKTVLKGSK